ncbi:porin family protein [Bradyrhizobium sp. AUGA SZCCT0177]|uniref:outer membrane protein n=1 Tax=Bradyrhizobium sp. AUGA SZCCT0177 TaxID=2807665 RepID=UPI001BA83055|nr:porin family protein [Bradyrhizobium sp. AUGA SZCCT0177]
MKKLVVALLLVAAGTVGASAADLGPRTYSKAPVAVAPIYNWTGFYVGLNAGGAWNDSNPTTRTLFPVASYFADSSVTAIGIAGDQKVNRSGFTGGVTGGYNWQINNAVVGLEADFNYFGVRGSTANTTVYPCCAPTSFTINSSVSTDWLATVRGRVGFLATPAFLIYGTGGLAVANVKANYLFTDTFAAANESASISSTRYGWTAGVGGEYALMNGWSIKAEYLYVDLGRASTTSNNLSVFAGATPLPLQTFTHTVNLTSNIGRVGINYKFGGPVVAKY